MLCRSPRLSLLPVLITTSIALSGAPRAQALDLELQASNSGPVLTPWSGALRGPSDVIAYSETPDGRRTWVSESRIEVTPPIPPETWFPGPLAGRHAMYQLVQFVVDWILSCYMPSEPTILGALTNYEFSDSLVATNGPHGIVILAGATSSSLPVPHITGTIHSSAETAFQYCLNSYIVWGSVIPNGPGSALSSGWAALPLQDGSTLILTAGVQYTFDPSLTLPAPYEFEHSGSFDLVMGEPQTWAIQSTYSEWLSETSSVQGPSSTATPTTWGHLKSTMPAE